MSLKKVLVSGAAALALMGTAASAVTLEQDGTGDYLIAPVYYAVANWSTTLKVVNTNTTRAIVAKVIVRDAKSSDEIMDFPIYLTPGDVWTGTIKAQNGKVVLVSTDDSMIIGGTPASKNNPIVVDNDKPYVEKDTSNPYNVIDRTNWHGYVEVFGMVSYDAQAIATACNNDAGVVGDPYKASPLDKVCFYNKVAKPDIANGNLSTDYDAGDVANSDLMGKEIIFADAQDANARRSMMLNMLAFGDVSKGAATNGVIGAYTNIANMIKGQSVTTALSGIDNVLGKSKIYVMYEGDGTNLNPIRTHFTVPTKKYWYETLVNLDNTSYAYSDLYGTQDDPGGVDQKFTAEYYYALNTNNDKITFRDNEEHTKSCFKSTEVSGGGQEDCTIPVHEEVHFFQDTATNSVTYDASNPIAQYAFKEGGYIEFDLNDTSYQINDGKYVNYKGWPIIPTTFSAKNVRGLYLNNWLYNQYEAKK